MLPACCCMMFCILGFCQQEGSTRCRLQSIQIQEFIKPLFVMKVPPFQLFHLNNRINSTASTPVAILVTLSSLEKDMSSVWAKMGRSLHSITVLFMKCVYFGHLLKVYLIVRTMLCSIYEISKTGVCDSFTVPFMRISLLQFNCGREGPYGYHTNGGQSSMKEGKWNEMPAPNFRQRIWRSISNKYLEINK